MSKLINNLNVDIDAFIKINDGKRRGAGPPDNNGKNTTHVPKGGGKLVIHVGNSSAIKNLHLFLVMDEIPQKNSEGIQINPGHIPGVTAHHFEFLIKNGKYEVVIHYKQSSEKRNGKQKGREHEDPEVSHPEG